MEKKLALLIAPVFALGLIASPVKAKPRILWEKHEIYTEIKREFKHGQNFILEDRSIDGIEICLKDIDHDKFQKIDTIIKEYFESITKDNLVRAGLKNIGINFIDNSYDRTENPYDFPKDSTIRSFNEIIYSAKITGGCKVELSYGTYQDQNPSLVVKLKLPANHEYNKVCDILEVAGIDPKEFPKSLKELGEQPLSISYPSDNPK